MRVVASIENPTGAIFGIEQTRPYPYLREGMAFGYQRECYRSGSGTTLHISFRPGKEIAFPKCQRCHKSAETF